MPRANRYILPDYAYTHTSAAAACPTVASLPDITGQARPELPPSGTGVIVKSAVRALVES